MNNHAFSRRSFSPMKPAAFVLFAVPDTSSLIQAQNTLKALRVAKTEVSKFIQ